MTKREDLNGRVFGNLRVKSLHHVQNGRSFWLCQCVCGQPTVARADGLKCGDYVSCGCSKITQLRIHGCTGSTEHKAWCAMIERCHTKTHQSYKRYGGRGIYVCDEWRSNFSAFLAHIGPKPSPELTLDRINNAEGYRPGNVRWATRAQQAANRDQNNQHTIKKVA